jgi:hypothetical protein
MLAGLIVAILALQAVPLAQTGPTYVDGCSPCHITLQEGTAPADFRFDLATGPEGRVIKAVQFERDGHLVQRLEVPSMIPRAADEQFFFGGQDINFDGWLDLVLMTAQGTANSSAQYWVYDPSTGKFRDLGRLPLLSVDSFHKRLSSYVSNGPAGLDFEKREYGFEGQSLVVLSEVTQKATTRAEYFERTTRRRQNGKLMVVKVKTIKAPK